MDLTFASAFSVGGLVGHVAYLLLVLSMLMRTLFWLRLLVIASALTAILYAGLWLRDPVSLFWESLLVTVNVIQIAVEWGRRRRARFSAEEHAFVKARFPGLGPHEARRLLDLGQWGDLAPGTRLTTQDRTVTRLVYLAGGRVDVEVDGRRVATCLPGNFVGEMSLVDGGTASATTTVAESARAWQISSQVVERLRADQGRLIAALELGIAQDLKAKIMAANADAR